jgi:hypothetical protein
MNLSYRQLVAPFVGALVGWLASKGLSLTDDQTTALVGLCAGAVGGGVHVIESWVAHVRAPLPPPDVSTQKTLPKSFIAIPLTVLLLHLSGCASSPVQSTDEGLYAAEAAYATLEQSLLAGVQAGWLSKASAAAIDSKATAARAMVDAAKAAESTDPATASTDLATAATMLQALETQLNALQPGAPKP